MPNTQDHIRYLAGLKIKRGDDVNEVASSNNMNAIIGALLGLARGDTIFRGVNTLMRRTDTSITISALPGGGGGGTAANDFPFKVVQNTKPLEDDGIIILPGTVLGVMPTLDGVALDVVLPTEPPRMVFTETGLAALRINIDGISDTFRPLITSVEVRKMDGTTIVDDDGDPLDELTMIWDDENNKSSGYFYIKIAQLTVIPSEDEASQITGIIQYLTANVWSFIIVVDDIIIVSN